MQNEFSCSDVMCKKDFLGLQEINQRFIKYISCFFFFLMGLQGQHIILCASGNSSKSFGIYSFQEYYFSCSCFLYRLFRLYSSSSLCLVTFTGYTNEHMCSNISNMHLYKDKVQRESKKIKVGKCDYIKRRKS